MEISEIGERDLIARIQRLFKKERSPYEIGIGDDAAAVLNESDKLLLLTTDMLVEGNHFLKDRISFYDLGYKALAVNLSDIAAMGGTPGCALISLGLPPDLKLAEFDCFYAGIQEIALDYGVAIVGGDITSSKLGMVINIAVTGYVGRDKIIRQDGAKPGDLIAVSGELGGSQAGLLVLLKPELKLPPAARKKALNRHCRPIPRVKEGVFLASTGKIHSMKDISDGLAKEMNTIANSSGVKAIIDTALIPIAPWTAEISRILNKSALEMAIQGGEEYELLFTFASEDYAALCELSARHGVNIHLIGRIEEGAGVFLETDGKREPLIFKGYQHF